MKVPLGVILAGGTSRRMGRDKGLVHLGGKPLLTHVIDRALPQVSELLLNMNSPAEFGLPIIADRTAEPCGPLGGILTALYAAREKNHDRVVTFACDTPFIPLDFTERLMEQDTYAIVIATSGKYLHAVMGLWHISLIDRLETYLAGENRKLMDWISGQNYTKVVWDDKPFDPFFNINKKEDLVFAENTIMKK